MILLNFVHSFAKDEAETQTVEYVHVVGLAFIALDWALLNLTENIDLRAGDIVPRIGRCFTSINAPERYGGKYFQCAGVLQP